MKPAKKRRVRIITMDMIVKRRRIGGYTNLERLKEIMYEGFGSINATAKATLNPQKTLDRRMKGKSEFRFDEILRLAYVLCMTEEEVHEVFFANYVD